MTTRIETRVGMAGWGDNRFRGRSVAEQLVGRSTLAQLLALAIGVELDADEAAMFDELAASATLADPHIWPLKLTRVIGAHGGSPMSGFVGGLLATDGVGLGPGSVRPATTWLHRLATEGPEYPVLDEVRAMLARGERLPGFGVPARKIDERVAAMVRCVTARGRAELRHWAIWSMIVNETRTRGLEPNVGSAFSAAVLDLGFAPEDVVVVVHLCCLPCFLANAVEGAKQPAAVLRAVPPELLDYQGPARTPSPRARHSF